MSINEIEKETIDQFDSLLSSCDDENQMQTFLESNTVFIPKRFMENHGISNNVIISKEPLNKSPFI